MHQTLPTQYQPGTNHMFNNQQIANQIGCALSTVRKWRKRYIQTGQIKDAPRPGAPRRFPPEVRATATALACRVPRTQNLPLARHSSSTLARQLIELKSVVKISAG